MKKAKIIETEEGNYKIKNRRVPEGCKHCLNGSKVVLFLNGICQKPDHCAWYCPISSERKGVDVSFADEIKINSMDDLLEEIKAIKATGMSITGGEPLSDLNLRRTLEYIKYIKERKGKKFHVHLYTNGVDFSESTANKLADMGLDEIRFHPAPGKWSCINLALNKGMSVGAELPIIPNDHYIKDLKDLIYFLNGIGADFINLNEFEYCFPNSQELKNRGFVLKHGTIASVEHSREIAKALMDDIATNVKIQIHFCSIIAKDYFQLKNRYLRRAKTIRLPFEDITEEGLLFYAQIEGNAVNLKLFYDQLLLRGLVPKNFIDYKRDLIKIPWHAATEIEIVKLLKELRLEGMIIETIPFRGEYCQITETTPINVFLEEMGINED